MKTDGRGPPPLMKIAIEVETAKHLRPDAAFSKALKKVDAALAGKGLVSSETVVHADNSKVLSRRDAMITAVGTPEAIAEVENELAKVSAKATAIYVAGREPIYDVKDLE